MAISVNMFGLRLTNDAHARAKKGQPAHQTTGVDSTNPAQLRRPPLDDMKRPPVSMSAIVTTNTGAVRSAAIASRRVMSTSSGFGASSGSEAALDKSGSSAIPHFGQAPGSDDRTSGSIGQK